MEEEVSDEIEMSGEEPSTPSGSMVELPAVNPADYPGDVVTAGSSTVFPLAEVIAGLYEGEGGGNITIDSIGSGAGFERFCVAGESDVSNASRAIKDSEVESCQSIGREPIEFRVGTDAIAVAVSVENDFVTDVTMEELAAIVSIAETWSDVRAEWPNEAILRYIPGTDSGTFDYFVEEVFDEDPEPILNASNTQLSEDDNVLVQGVVGSPYAVAFYGYAYYVENADVTNVLSIDGIEATLETVDSFTYPLARPLFIYSDASIMQEKSQVAAYINYFLTHANDVIDEVGYFPANEEVLNVAKLLWLNATSQ
jgi:phosphate transport system substrate-binding protein